MKEFSGKCYIVPLRSTKQTKRYSVYYMRDNGFMEILWARELDYLSGRHKLYPYQVYSKTSSLPAFHFVIKNKGVYSIHHLAGELQKLGFTEIYSLEGYHPSVIRMGE